MNRRDVMTFFGTTAILGLSGFVDSEKDINSHQPKSLKDESEDQNFSSMKTIGILGGIGPQATMDLEAHIHHSAQRSIPQLQNSGYPPMIVHYLRHASVLLKNDHTPVFPLQPDPRLLEAAKKIGAVSDFLLISSNGIHMFQKEIEAAAGRKVLSMIDATLREVGKRNWKKVAVLGFGSPMIYINRLKESNISFETIDDTLQQNLDQSIMRVMEGRNKADDSAVAEEAIKFLRLKKVDGIIPGCTEIPLLLRDKINSPDLVNPAALLAEEAVKYAIS